MSLFPNRDITDVCLLLLCVKSRKLWMIIQKNVDLTLKWIIIFSDTDSWL